MPTVLVVDDDPVIQKLLQFNFEMEGWTVLLADDGEAGLTMARLERPDAVLLDVMMPKLNGLAVAAALKSEPSTEGIPVILLSAKAQATDIGDGLATGADAYVTKPFDPLDLLERVTSLIAQR
ncbi:MAG TPA: response regulator [Acidimicrobiales bacterium]|nr:response regulator [Acidimicrobiales bacterium]